ncbi:uncharacterized protein [Rutidosis leptorrhynchoides]|uniref:uncharacterized protein isoform X2 n=1 Tax=Rutidosis leptorrhynchoides TaxID=125765 RepID=UPI003A99DCA6
MSFTLVKVCSLTGANKGIGFETVRQLATSTVPLKVYNRWIGSSIPIWKASYIGTRNCMIGLLWIQPGSHAPWLTLILLQFESYT